MLNDIDIQYRYILALHEFAERSNTIGIDNTDIYI